MRKTAIMNLKGGTGKTVSTINLAAFLAKKHGQRVLLIDADSQGNLTEFVSEKIRDKGTIYDLLTGKECIALQPTRMRQVDILQADPRLMALDVTAAGMGAADQMALKSFLAENADPALTQPIEAMCLQNQIPCAWVGSMSDLGHACGIDVGAAAAAVLG